MKEANVVIYHYPCNDGVGSAAICSKVLPESDTHYLPWNYGKGLPDYEFESHQVVYVVDFSFLAEDVVALCGQVNKVIILDHHVTAIKRLEEDLTHKPDNLEMTLDTSRSGVGLCWDYFFPDEDMPAIYAALEDRDLWKFDSPWTKGIHAALMVERPSIEDMKVYEDEDAFAGLIHQGEVILKYEEQLHKDFLPLVTLRPSSSGNVAFIFCSYPMASDMASYVLANMPEADIFAALIMRTERKEVKLSVRSRPGSVFAVNELAEVFGGGGHKHAAGFSVAWDSFFEEFHASVTQNVPFCWSRLSPAKDVE